MWIKIQIAKWIIQPIYLMLLIAGLIVDASITSCRGMNHHIVTLEKGNYIFNTFLKPMKKSTSTMAIVELPTIRTLCFMSPFRIFYEMKLTFHVGMSVGISLDRINIQTLKPKFGMVMIVCLSFGRSDYQWDG